MVKLSSHGGLVGRAGASHSVESCFYSDGGSNPALVMHAWLRYLSTFFENGGRYIVRPATYMSWMCVISMDELKDYSCLEK